MGDTPVKHALRGRALGSLALLLVFCLSCVSSPMMGQVRRSIRSPGEYNSALPEEVWEQYKCGKRKLPFLRVESLALSPQRLEAGEEFNHRWVYSLCPVTPTAVVEGRLQTQIFFKGEAIMSDANDRYELKPGRWVIDTFVQVPPQAPPGVYSIEIAFRSRMAKFHKRHTFAVH